jgi:transposase
MSHWLDIMFPSMALATGKRDAVKVRQAYRFALDPTPAQERMLRSHAGASRFAWNWSLTKCRERYAAEGKWYSAVDLHKLWNTEKKADPSLAWWAENSKCVYQEAFRNLDRALHDFTASKKGRRKGQGLGFPKRKKKGKTRDSCGLVLDRDVNAARNLLSLAVSGAERLNACGAAVRPGLAGHAVLKQEPGTANASKTGTAAQRWAAAA